MLGILVGVVLCGIPLAVITSLYVQLISSSTTTIATTVVTTTSLPSQCTTYTSDGDTTRNIAYTGCTDCRCDNTLSAGWFRFVGGAGSRLITTPYSTFSCGARLTGWFNGTLPTIPGQNSSGTVCVNSGGDLCQISYSLSSISVTNCNGFYVFNLRAMTTCNSRYCTT